MSRAALKRAAAGSLDRLYIWQKLSLLGFVFLLLFSIPFALYLRGLAGELSGTREAMRGVGEALATVELAGALSAHRAAAAGSLAGAGAMSAERDAARREVDARLRELEALLGGDAELAQAAGALRSSWEALAEAVARGRATITDSHDRHARIAAAGAVLRERLLEARGLSFYADPAVSHAAAVAFVHAPEVAESLGRIRARTVGVLAARTASPDDRMALEADGDRVREEAAALMVRLAKARDADAALGDALAQGTARAQAQLAEFMRKAGEAIAPGAQPRHDAREHGAEQAGAVDGYRALGSAAAAEVLRRLEARAGGYYLGIAATLLMAVAAVGVALAFGIWIGRSIARPLGHAVRVADGIAAGRLDHAIDPGRARIAEAARLMTAFASMQEGLSALAAEIQGAGGEIHRASARVSQGNTELSARTERQAASLEDTAATLEQLTAAVHRNAGHAAEAARAVEAAKASARRGGAAVESATETMSTINSSATRIGDIIGVIDGIAFQTNILALNAAVEAARAGDEGRGFAVVAAEVRALAQRSTAAAREVKGLVGESTGAAALGTRRVGETAAAMGEIMQAVEGVAALFAQIAAASAEQGEAIGQVNRAVTALDRSTQDNAAMVGEAAAASEALRGQALRLSELVARFRLAGPGTAPNAPGAAVPALARVPEAGAAE